MTKHTEIMIKVATKQNKSGWHITIDGVYNFYSKKSFRALVKAVGRPIVAIYGNGIQF
jgi:hypothetical protein